MATSAAPEAVYDVLADLRTHLEWGGTRQRSDFRLLSLDAGHGPARVGTTFASTGTIPMSGRRWNDRSTITAAERPTVFEFETEAHAGGGDGMTARYRHRFEVAAQGQGSQLLYSLTELAVTRPMLRMALPGMREMTWRVAIPMYARRGLRGLLSMAAERAADASTRSTPVVAGHPIHTQEN